MAVTQTDLDALVKAYVSGKLRASYDGRSVEYRSLADMAEAIAALARILGVADPLSVSLRTPPRRTYLEFRRAT